jgi:hypothetical protein
MREGKPFRVEKHFVVSKPRIDWHYEGSPRCWASHERRFVIAPSSENGLMCILSDIADRGEHIFAKVNDAKLLAARRVCNEWRIEHSD